MKKIIIAAVLFCFIFHSVRAQLTLVDSLKMEIRATTNDTVRLVLLSKLTSHYFELDFEQLGIYSKPMLHLAKKLGYKIEEAYAMQLIGIALSRSSKPEEAFKMFLNGIAIVSDKRSEKNILPKKYLDEMDYYGGQFISKERYTPEFLRLDVLGGLYFDLAYYYGIKMGNTKKQLIYFKKAKQLFDLVQDSSSYPSYYTFMGDTYNIINQLDSGLYYAKLGDKYYSEAGLPQYSTFPKAIIGMILYKKGNMEEAYKYLLQAIKTYEKYGKTTGISRAMLTLSEYHVKNGRPDSGLIYAKRAFDMAEKTNDYLSGAWPKSSAALATHYKNQNKVDSALKYYELTISLLNTMHSDASNRLIQSQDYEEQMQQQELEVAKTDYVNRQKSYAFLAGIGILLIIGAILFRNNYQRKKANSLLRKQKTEIEEQKRNVEGALSNLKATQSQLIQSEKMASLGELTAGIAHEIQNPLNFVNNFSEVSNELIEEMKEEIGNANYDDVKAIADDVKANLEKILHHGKRADAIVKGMLQHSRSSTGTKEPTDINTLADEYLRLAYHGLRAKDKSFNATLNTDFDKSIGNINIIPQDIGRMILNLITNAFYAVDEKKKVTPAGYQPTVSVSTKKRKDKVEVKVSDNGSGIPQKILEKIFQPFFTTKPTGEGTGLGLSLAYDIVKAHGGELKVETKEGRGSEFIIELPTNQQ